MRAWIKWSLVCLVGLLILTSAFTRPPASKPAGSFLDGASVPPAILHKLENSCGDCHSCSPRYPWYSYVAPVSWLIKRDVAQGREHLNFSHWNEYSMIRRQRALSEIANQVQDREMPLPLYIRLHSGSKLSESDIAAIFNWTQTERRRLIVGNRTGVVPGEQSK